MRLKKEDNEVLTAEQFEESQFPMLLEEVGRALLLVGGSMKQKKKGEEEEIPSEDKLEL